MNEIDGIRIGDINYEKVCLNCIHWRVDMQFDGPANGVICIKGEGHTKPTNTCRQFSPNRSVDNQDLNRYMDKKNRYSAWKLYENGH